MKANLRLQGLRLQGSWVWGRGEGTKKACYAGYIKADMKTLLVKLNIRKHYLNII